MGFNLPKTKFDPDYREPVINNVEPLGVSDVKGFEQLVVPMILPTQNPLVALIGKKRTVLKVTSSGDIPSRFTSSSTSLTI